MIKKLLFLSLLLINFTFAGTTGKISGTITNGESGEAIPGVNVILVGTGTGAATDVDGFYLINNVPPGKYNIIFSAVGYQKKEIQGVLVSADFTTKLDIKLSETSVEIEAVIVQAEAPLIRKDLTSSHVSVNAEQIENLPVESINQVLSLQAGIVQGTGGELHIRGGRSNEISYAVNGVSISNPFDNSRTVQIATNAIQELSVVSGTFNAEYGNALSGIVNTITKEGGSAYKGKISFYSGDHVSSRKNVFFNIDDVDPLNDYVTEATLSGPIPFLDKYLTFFVSGRYENDEDYFYGIREHLPTDSVYKNPANPDDIKVSSSGDGKIVPMSPSKDISATGKLTFKPTSTIKINYDAVYSRSESKFYDHDLKYNPDASYNNYEWGLLNSLEVRHAINNKTFYSLKGAFNFNDYKQYLYPLIDGAGNDVNYYPGKSSNLNGFNLGGIHADPRYQPDYKLNSASGYTFLSGGTQNNQYYQRSRTISAKFDITSQISNSHEVKFGLDYEAHKIDFENFRILRDSTTYLVPTIPGLNTVNHELYTRRPKEFSAYLQDKMEFESMIVNVGLRYDYFKANSEYSTDIFHPSPNYPGLPSNIDPNTLLAKAPGKSQISPRVGISFPITDRGIIHFSYGHFFQMPPFSYLYTNPNFKYNFASGSPTFGNANLNPEKTVSYEIGLQQQLFEDLAFNVTGFYKDVRDLLALQEIRISGDQTYFKYVNKDYGNIKGITFSLMKRRSSNDMFAFTLDYTFQVAEGNETNSDAFFLDLSSGRQSEKVPVYLTWDQTHTLNATASIGESKNWNVTLVGRFGTGLPYTPQISGNQIFLRTNSGRRPSQASVDLLAEKIFNIYGFNFSLFLKIYNLFDTLNERLIYNDTGRATYTLVANQSVAQATDKLSEKIPAIHSASEYFNHPDYYLPPRNIKLGVSFEF